MKRIYTNQQFIEAVASSTSIAQVLKKLQLNPTGGNYRTFHKLVKELQLDISHFKGRGWSKGTTIGFKRPIEDYLSNTQTIQSYKLKRRLLNEGYFQPKCYKCNLVLWLDKPIPLELEHIDGNHLNNNLNNLTLLCPNCHAQTPTYRGKNSTKISSALPRKRVRRI